MNQILTILEKSKRPDILQNRKKLNELENKQAYFDDFYGN
jgi:hypothetical protein